MADKPKPNAEAKRRRGALGFLKLIPATGVQTRTLDKASGDLSRVNKMLKKGK